MACGFCSLEQPVASQCVGCGKKLACASRNPLGKATRYWEGGAGCRDIRSMANKVRDEEKERGEDPPHKGGGSFQGPPSRSSLSDSDCRMLFPDRRPPPPPPPLPLLLLTLQDPHKYRGKAKTKSNKAGRVGPKAWSKDSAFLAAVKEKKEKEKD